MASDDDRGARPVGPAVLRIKLRYDDAATMVQRFATNVGKSGLFLPTRSIQPIGTEVKFELRLANDTPVLVGLGRVKQVKSQDPARPKAAFGMALELMRVSREGRELIIKMLERRRALGLPDVAIPMPEDVDASRRSQIETQPRTDTSGIVREAMADFASAPVAEQVLSVPPSGPIATRAVEPSGPIATRAVEPSQPSATRAAEPPASESAPPTSFDARPRPARASSAPLLTSPRESGPIPTIATDAASGRRSVPMLAPEPPRSARPRVSDLIARAAELSGPLAAARLAGFDDAIEVDVEAAVARARALVGRDLDVELAALRDAVAAPVEITIEAASAELARQLGGTPIARRERSRHWAPSPPPADELRGEPNASIASVEDRSVPTAPEQVADADELAAGERVAFSSAPDAPIEAAPVEAAPVEEVLASGAVDARDEGARDDDAAASVPVDASDEGARAEDGAASVAVEAGDDGAARDVEVTFAPLDPAPAATLAPDGERTRVPSGDELEDAFMPGASTTTAVDSDVLDAVSVEGLAAPRSFVAVDEAQLRTQPGNDAGSAGVHDDDVDAAALQRILEGSQPALQLDESDLELVDDNEFADERGENTQIGAFPIDPHAFGNHGQPTVPDDLAAHLDRHLAHAEAEADAELSGLDGGDYHEPVAGSGRGEHGAIGYDEPQPAGYGEPAAGYGESAAGYGEPAAGYGEQSYDGEQGYGEQGYGEHGEHGCGEQGAAAQPEHSDEVSDLDVLAEAEAGDADLLHADGEADASAVYAAIADTVGGAPDDFAARLALDEDSPLAAHRYDAYGRAADGHHGDHGQHTRHGSQSHGRPGYPRLESEFPDPPSESYTFAEPVPQAALYLPPDDDGLEPSARRDADDADDTDELQGFVQTLRGAATKVPVVQAQPREDLEDALAALDVDVDDFEALERRRARRSSAGSQRPLPGLPEHRPPRDIRQPTRRPPIPTRPPPIPTRLPPIPTRPPPTRATTDDGILIDFDDDD